MSLKLDERNDALGPDARLATYETLIDDDKTRITRWHIAPGEVTGWHRHEWDYVTIQQSGGRLKLDMADGGEMFIDYEDGCARAFSAPVEHNATNVGDVEVRVLEIER